MTSSTVTENLLRSSDPVDLARRLVAAGQPWCENSLDGPVRPPQETRASEIIAPMLAELGFDVELVGRSPQRLNLVARLRFGPGPVLLLNDHLDTYPAGPAERWAVCEDPYDAVADDGRLFARGTSDTRGNLTALLLAVAQVVADPPDTGTLVVALTVDEERNGVEGALHLVEQGMTADASITVEPTSWGSGADGGIDLAVQHTGHALVDVVVRGRSSHIWRPDTGVNAAHHLLAVLAAVQQERPSGWGLSVVGLDAGEAGMAQFTPLVAAARVAVVGIGPDVVADEVLAELAGVGRRCLDADVESGGPGCELEVALAPGPTFVPGTLPVPSADAVVTALEGAYLRRTGQALRHYVKPAYCDTIRFRHAGIPAVTFGPGEDGWAVYDESIDLAHVQTATDVLADAVRTFLGGDRRDPGAGPETRDR